jgi:hypothetical protein
MVGVGQEPDGPLERQSMYLESTSRAAKENRNALNLHGKPRRVPTGAARDGNLKGQEPATRVNRWVATHRPSRAQDGKRG